jgi:2-amino-4-hydroxy-6-hydroxymethyldihydropteridine diphosphokinase
VNRVETRLAYIGIGSNLDDPERQVRAALEALRRLPRSTFAGASRLYRTAPWGRADQPWFVNAAAAISTVLSPRELLEALLAIERAQGRTRDGERWGPRAIDLDILVYGDLAIDEPGLRIPHPHLRERAFVLLPLADLDPALEIPGQGRVDALATRVDATGCTLLLEPARAGGE